jgi:predicted permease
MPDWKPEIQRRLAALRLSAAREVQLTEELSQHLEDHYAELIAGGMSAESARQIALEGLDRHELLGEMQKTERVSKVEPVSAPAPGRSLFSGLGGDVRYSLRGLRKTPAFTVIAVLTMALGIAANTAIFSVINSLFLHPPGIMQSDRLVAVRVNYDKLALKNIEVSLTDYADVRDSKQVFSSVAASQFGNFNYRNSAGTLERLLGDQVTWQWFDTFGARPLLGRVFDPSEDLPGGEHEVVLSYATWDRMFGKDRGVVGKSILLNEQSYRVVGVMGADFNWPSEAQIWLPLGRAPADFGPDNRFNESYNAFARLAPGVSSGQAEAYVRVLSERVRDRSSYARSSQWSMAALPFSEFVYGDLRTPMLVLAGTVAFVLMICCANMAGLLLARASGRGKELAVRSALGARRAHLIRQVFVDSSIIAAAGTIVGLLLAWIAVRNAALIAPAGSIGNLAIPIDRSVLLFTVGAGLLSALLFGIAPAWGTAGTKSFALLKEGGRWAMPSKGRQRARSALVIVEVGLALVLLVGAGLFLKSLLRIERLSPGFDARGVMTAAVSLDPKAYSSQQKIQAVFMAVTQNLAGQPGVEAGGAGFPLPFSGIGGASSFAIEGRPLAKGDPGPHSDIATATPGLFRTLSIPLRAGRYFTEEDRMGTEPVCIIDENLVREYWPGQNPVGARIRRGTDWTRIVGVVGHVHRSSLAGDTGKGLAYYPLYQLSIPMVHLMARTSGDPAMLAPALREAVRAADPSQAAVYDLKPLNERIDASLGPRRFAVTMLIAFASIALFMAALGLYGLISYSVTQRTREIGVRMALGAQLGQVLWMVIAQSLRLVLSGALIGLVVALALARLLSSELVQISAFDPVTFVSMCAVLIVVTLAATCLPASRAARVDPTVALRYE